MRSAIFHEQYADNLIATFIEHFLIALADGGCGGHHRFDRWSH
jgi:hypothetical protein